jgi:hypothetical protein
VSAQIDDELVSQIRECPDDAVEAVLMLHSADPQEPAATPEEIEPLVKRLHDRASVATGHTADQVNVFRNMGSIAIAAKGKFLQALIEQPEVASAMANRK